MSPGRNRLTQTAVLVGFKERDIASETMATYTCQLINAVTSELITESTELILNTVIFTLTQIDTAQISK